MPRATTSSMTRKRLATSFMTKAEVKSIRQFALDWKCIGARDLDLPIIVLRVVWECRRNSKHQLMLETSYPDMETHANLTPVQVYATCMCLPKRKAKKHGHCQKSCQGFGQLFGKGRLFGRPIFKQTLRNYQPCVSTPKTPEQHKECVKQKKTVSHNSCPIFFILPLMRNIPLTTMTFIVFCFGKRALERNASMFILWTWGGMLLKGIFLTNF